MRGSLHALAAAGVLLLAACSPAPSPSAGLPGASAAQLAAPATATPAPAPASAATATPASPAAPSTALPSGVTTARDPGLLALLPASVGGITVSDEPQAFAQALADAAFVANVDRAVFPLAVGGSDLTSGVIAHLRPGVYSDAMFADWRATYDSGACQQSGNVLAHAEETAGGRATYVTTCAGGLRVYHTYLPSRGVIISLLTVGPADLGGQLMRAVRG